MVQARRTVVSSFHRCRRPSGRCSVWLILMPCLILELLVLTFRRTALRIFSSSFSLRFMLALYSLSMFSRRRIRTWSFLFSALICLVRRSNCVFLFCNAIPTPD